MKTRRLIFATFLGAISLNVMASLVTVTFDVTVTRSSYIDYNKNIYDSNSDTGDETISITYDTAHEQGFILNNDTLANKIINPLWESSFASKMLPQFVGKNSNNNSIGAGQYLYSALGGNMGGSIYSKTINEVPVIPRNSSWDSSIKQNSIIINSFYQNPLNGYLQKDVQINTSLDFEENLISNMLLGTTFGVSVISEDYSKFLRFGSTGVFGEIFYTGASYNWSGTATIKSVIDSADITPTPIPSSIWLFLGAFSIYSIVQSKNKIT